MTKKQLTIREWQHAWFMDQFNVDNVIVQIEAGWYDWFCKDSSLRNKTEKMGKIIYQVKNGGKINLDTMYVWFKNNCPLNSPLYDDFRFADLETGETQLTIQINCCWNDMRYAVYGRKYKGGEFSQEPLFKTNKVNELVNWLNTPWEK